MSKTDKIKDIVEEAQTKAETPEDEKIRAAINDTTKKSSKAFKIQSVCGAEGWQITHTEELIKGVVRRGGTMLMGAPSKCRKTWWLVTLATTAAAGRTWLDFEYPKKLKVLFLDFELTEPEFRQRIKYVADAQGIHFSELEGLSTVHLRGQEFELYPPRSKKEQMAFRDGVPFLSEFVEKNATGYDLIILDPLYCVLTGDENSNSDMRGTAQFMTRLAQRTGAVVVASHHFAKGPSGGKEAVDRMSGAGVFARFPDALIAMSPLDSTEETDGFPIRMEFTLRSFKPRSHVDMRFRFPSFVVDETGELASLKVKGASGRPAAIERKSILEAIPRLPKDKRNISSLADKMGVTRNTMKKYLKEYDIKLNENTSTEDCDDEK